MIWRMGIFLVLVISGFDLGASPIDDNCFTCHSDFEDEEGPADLFTRDIHFQKGIGCYGCHGGDPTLDDMDEVWESEGFVGVPDYLEVPSFCARCHSDPAYMREHNPALPTDQLDKYKTSVHGKLLFGKKDEKVANCVSCHTAHQIGDEKLPHSSTYPLNLPQTCGNCHADADYMAEYGMPTDQLEEYTHSVHGEALFGQKDLGAPACNDCHGNHGAAPPGVSSLAAVCGNCHAIEAELFAASPMMKAFQENNYPMCVTCHGNHGIVKPTDELIGSRKPAFCADCHSAPHGPLGAATADSMLLMINRLVAARSVAKSTLDEAREKGMPTVNEEFRMKEVDQALIQTRTMVHSFVLERLSDRAMAGVAKADTLRLASEKLIDQYYFRRKGLAWSTVFITIVVIGLFIKVRRLG